MSGVLEVLHNTAPLAHLVLSAVLIYSNINLYRRVRVLEESA